MAKRFCFCGYFEKCFRSVRRVPLKNSRVTSFGCEVSVWGLVMRWLFKFRIGSNNGDSYANIVG